MKHYHDDDCDDSYRDYGPCICDDPRDDPGCTLIMARRAEAADYRRLMHDIKRGRIINPEDIELEDEQDGDV